MTTVDNSYNFANRIQASAETDFSEFLRGLGITQRGDFDIRAHEYKVTFKNVDWIEKAENALVKLHGAPNLFCTKAAGGLISQKTWESDGYVAITIYWTTSGVLASLTMAAT